MTTGSRSTTCSRTPGSRSTAGQRPARETCLAEERCLVAWLAQLGAHGLVREFVRATRAIRQLRDLTRARTAITRDGRRPSGWRSCSRTPGSSCPRSPPTSRCLGTTDARGVDRGQPRPGGAGRLAKRRLRSKIPELTEALTGRFSEHHAFLARVHLDLIDRHTAAIETLTGRIEVMIEPFQGFRDLICTIPGISTLTADVVIAETGADMTRFPTAKHRVWAGTTPARSAGKVKSAIPPARCARRRRDVMRPEPTHLRRRPLSPHRLTPRTPEGQRRDPALHAHRDLAHGHHRHPLRGPRSRLLTTLHPERAKNRAIHQLEAMGYRVTLDHAS